jgi:hypothetical protein
MEGNHVTLTPHEEDIVKAIAELALAEINGTAEPCNVSIGPFSMFQLIGALQLALRHPNMPASIRDTILQIARSFATCFNEGTTARAAIEAGFNPANDIPFDQDSGWGQHQS